MRSLFAAAIVLASLAAARAEEAGSSRLDAPELRNVWRTCDVSGRARAAKVRCINEQSENVVRGKSIEQINTEAEAATRRQVGAHGE